MDDDARPPDKGRAGPSPEARGDSKDVGGVKARDCIQIDIRVYDQPNKISFRVRGQTEYLYWGAGSWGNANSLFDKTYTYTDPYFGK